MTSFKLANTAKTIEIGGVPCRAGRLTLGAALSIEEFLATLPTPYETLDKSNVLAQVGKELADQLVGKALSETMFWPPDAITALSDRRFLVRADFSRAVISAVLTAYNPHMSPDEINSIVNGALVPQDMVKIQIVAFGGDLDPKEEDAGASLAEAKKSPESGSTGPG